FDENELKADYFASFFLMPKDGIMSLIPNEEFNNNKVNLSLDTIVKLEQYFQVSRSAMLYRLKDLQFIDNETYNEYSSGVIKSARRRGYKESLYVANRLDEFLSNYGDMANSLVESEK